MDNLFHYAILAVGILFGIFVGREIGFEDYRKKLRKSFPQFYRTMQTKEFEEELEKELALDIRPQNPA